MTINSLTSLLDNEKIYYSSNDLVFMLHSSFAPHRIATLSMILKFLDKCSDEEGLLLLIERDILKSTLNLMH